MKNLEDPWCTSPAVNEAFNKPGQNTSLYQQCAAARPWLRTVSKLGSEQFFSSAALSWWLRGCISEEDYGGSASFRTNCCSPLFHASMWSKTGVHTDSNLHTQTWSVLLRLGFRHCLSFPPNSDGMFLSAWQMLWPTFPGKPWHISPPHNPPLATWILDSLLSSFTSPMFLSLFSVKEKHCVSLCQFLWLRKINP